MKDKGRDRGSQINVGEKVLPWGRDGERRGGRSPAGGEGRQTGSSAGAEVGVPRERRGESRCYLQASAGLFRWCRAQAAGQSVAVAPTPAGRGAGKGLQPLTES